MCHVKYDFNLVRQSLESLDPLVVFGRHEHSSFLVSRSLKNETKAYEHSSLFLSRSLKNETDPPPFESSPTLDQKLEPSFPTPSENIHISNQMLKRGKNKSRQRKRRLGRKIPLQRHVVRSDPRLGVVHIIK
jgi:hypothetical protein